MNKEDQISNAADVSPMSANSQSGSSFQIMTKTSFKETIFQPASDIGRKNSIKRTQTELGSNKALSPIQIQDVEVFITKPVESRLLTKAEKKEKKSLNKADRLAKEGKTLAPPKIREKKVSVTTETVSSTTSKIPTKQDIPRPQVKQMKKPIKKKRDGKSDGFFHHLSDALPMNETIDLIAIKVESGQIHSSIHALGLKFVTGKIVGGNARCLAMLNAFIKVINDYTSPPDVLLSRHLTTHISKQIDFLNTTRVLATTMKTAIRVLKNNIAMLPISLTDEEAKLNIIKSIYTFIETRISRPMEYISDKASSMIQQDDVILTYANSSLILNTFVKAKESNLDFQVIVIDSAPKFEGKKMMKALLDLNVSCTQMNINAISIALDTVTKVMVGASAVLANGSIMSRAGSATVCMMSHFRKIPVIVLTETYKFSDVTRLDSIAWNELGSQNEVCEYSRGKLDNWKEQSNLNIINLNYDLTPSEFITMAICEFNFYIPSTSAMTVLREMLDDNEVVA